MTTRSETTPAAPIPATAGSVPARLSLWLGVAGLLPLLPVLGSLAAVLCAAMALRDDPTHEDRHHAVTGLALGILGLLAPVAFLILYCWWLGYPFPIHPYRGPAR